MSVRRHAPNSGRPSFSSQARPAFRVLALLLAITAARAAASQTFSIIHNFTGGAEGASPFAGLVMDAAGNLYGTTAFAGSYGAGTVFELKHSGSAWVLNPLYNFLGGQDGIMPYYGGVTFAPDGTLFGTTAQGGTNTEGCGDSGCGTAFHLTPQPDPPVTLLPSWNEDIIHNFSAYNDGWWPSSAVVFDSTGALYGTTLEGSSSFGTIWKMTPSGGGWTEQVLTTFSGAAGDGMYPYWGLTPDSAGNFYGTTNQGGAYSWGTIYELSPSGGQWSKTILYSFTNGSDGGLPIGGVVFDRWGNLFGATTERDSGGGTIYELSPSNGNWAFHTLYSFTGRGASGPWGNLLVDSNGDLYGSALATDENVGVVFKLSHSSGAWTYTALHSFGGSDGAYPYGTLVRDASGNLYGTTNSGGEFNKGIVFEITP